MYGRESLGLGCKGIKEGEESGTTTGYKSISIGTGYKLREMMVDDHHEYKTRG